MPAAARHSERRPSAPTASRTRASPPACSIVTPASSLVDRERRRRNAFELERRGARFERRDQMPVLDIVAEGLEADFGGGEHTSGARNSRRVSSTMRIFSSGAACGRQACQTPSVSSAVTEPDRSAVVRLSGTAGGAISNVSTPAAASAIAATRPAGPPPTTATSAADSLRTAVSRLQPLSERPPRSGHHVPVKL